jgi:hypothetical protein
MTVSKEWQFLRPLILGAKIGMSLRTTYCSGGEQVPRFGGGITGKIPS